MGVAAGAMCMAVRDLVSKVEELSQVQISATDCYRREVKSIVHILIMATDGFFLIISSADVRSRCHKLK